MTRPFSRIAPYYDTMMEFINYPRWVGYVIDIIHKFKKSPKTILDLACGTGTPSLLLAKRGYRIVGLDSSKEMLRVMKEKLREYNPLLIHGDMRSFKLPYPVDSTICLFDSLNYLLTEKELINTFTSVYNNLRWDGLFIFDMNTIAGLTTYWGNQTFTREIKNTYSIWRTIFDKKKNISTLYLTLFVKTDKGYKRIEEVHQERGYKITDIESFLKSAGFNRVVFYQHLTFLKAKESNYRIMGVAEKE